MLDTEVSKLRPIWGSRNEAPDKYLSQEIDSIYTIVLR